jgi:hypothetical protein
MNCDECNEEVLELIEREHTDPEGVLEILERCPECRATFEALKSTLGLTADLPLEEPSVAVDEAIMRTATAHANRVVSLERRRFRPIPWAAAAVALLAVSVGVWSIPTDDAPPARFATQSAAESAAANEADEAHVVAEAPAELATLEDASEAMAGAEGLATQRRAQKKAARPSAARVATSGEASRGGAIDIAGAALSEAARLEQQLDAAPAAAPDEAPDTALARVEEQEEARARDRDCAAEAAALEVEGREVTGDQALDVGRCFRDAGDIERARRWLERASADPKTRTAAKRALRSLPKQ